SVFLFFFFQAEDGIRDSSVTGVQTCALPISFELEGSRFAEALPFVRGGFWRHFLVKYPEVNTLYRLALRAGAKIHAMAPGAQQTQALEELWAGEGNCPYWHGVFGGVYLPHIRGAAFSHLIAAEALADAAARDPGPYA